MQTSKIDRTKNWTVDDYVLLGETDTPCELINGDLIMSPAPNPYHQRVSKKLFKLLDASSANFGEVFYAPIDLYIDQKNVFQPDLLVISKTKSSLITNRGIEGPPEIVIEIISPSNIFIDRNTKKKTYLDFGVQEYWIVDPGNKTLEIYTPQTGEDMPILYLAEEGAVKSSVLVNLEFNLEEIFSVNP
jgi:Uma2 family endonuclease